MEIKSSINDYWDHIKEVEVDDSWLPRVDSKSYRDYRYRFARAQKRTLESDFPVCIEIEATYYCNLKCPFCPRVVNLNERENAHISPELWKKILDECGQNKLDAILMDHEAESLMNPKIFEMIAQARNAGIQDVWIHTNANQLSDERARKLIAAGVTKINFSIDATTPEVYDVLRVGGNFEKVLSNVKNFLRLKTELGAEFIRARISFVVQKANLHQRKAFLEYWKKVKGVNVIAFQECTDFLPFEKIDDDIALSAEELREKFKDSEPFHCSMPWEMPVIDIDGNVTPCGVPVRAHNKSFILGNLNKGDTIKSCWKGEKMSNLRNLHNNGEWFLNPVCRVCVNTVRKSRNELNDLLSA